MKRIRWFKAEWPFPLVELATKMKSQIFTLDSTDGFVIERIRENRIEALFVEKITYQEITSDPFGNKEIYDRIFYKKTGFTLFTNFPHIEIHDPPRSINEFINKLLELCDFSVAIEPLSLKLLDWAEDFQNAYNQKILIDSLQVSGIEIESGVSAKILLKGNKDVRSALEIFTNKRNYILDKIQVKIPVEKKIIPIHMTNVGIAKIPKDYVNDISEILRTSLSKKSN